MEWPPIPPPPAPPTPPPSRDATSNTPHESNAAPPSTSTHATPMAPTAIGQAGIPMPPRRMGYGGVADPAKSLYEMLHIEPHSSPDQVEESLREAQRWWNAQQANPKYRRQAGEALARLREARELLLDPIRRQEYDRHHQQFRQSFRARRWQPVQDLIDVLITSDTCDHDQQELLLRFAAKRGLSREETEALVGEECLKRGVQILPPPSPTTPPTQLRLHLPQRWVTTAMLLSLLGILLLPFYQLSRPAILLAFPFFNNLRLLLGGLSPVHATETETTPINGWDWFVGIAVLGGATITALSDLYNSPLFVLGLATASLSWLAWLGLVLSRRRDTNLLTQDNEDQQTTHPEAALTSPKVE